MKQVAGFWLPDGEVDLVPFLEASPRFFKGPTYQVDKLLACLPWIKSFGLALDVGAHCGLWSRVLVRMFRKVEAFEPVPHHIECFLKNVPEATLNTFALGSVRCSVAMKADHPGASGSSCVDQAGSLMVDVNTIDECDLDGALFDKVDFMKIDCEGFEHFVLKGGEGLIKADQPCIIVEQKQGMGSKYGLDDLAAVDLLKSWGAKERFDMSGDYCLSWD